MMAKHDKYVVRCRCGAVLEAVELGCEVRCWACEAVIDVWDVDGMVQAYEVVKGFVANGRGQPQIIRVVRRRGG